MSDAALAITISSQLAAISRSGERLTRIRAHAASLDSHAARLRAKLDAAAGDETSGPTRGELVEVDRRRRQAASVLSEAEADHADDRADLSALYGSDGAARARLAEAHLARAEAQTAADDVKALLDRARAHAKDVEARFASARAAEDRHDAEATDRLHAALRDGTETPTAVEPFVRTSAGLEDDARAARAAVDRLSAEHKAKVDALSEVERQVYGAADKVLTAEAEAMAREVVELDARTALLRQRLMAYAARHRGNVVQKPDAEMSPAKLHPGGWYYRDPPPPSAVPSTLPTTPAIAAALARPTQEPPGLVEGRRRTEATAWAAYAAALASDPQAEPDFADTPAPIMPAPTPFAMPAPVMPAPRAA